MREKRPEDLPLRRFRNSWEDAREAERDYEVSWWPHGSI